MKRTVLITGGAGSIGSGLARSFALQGDRVIIHYNKSEEQAAKLCALMRENGCSAEIFKADICNNEELKALARFAVDNDVHGNNREIVLVKLFGKIAGCVGYDNVIVCHINLFTKSVARSREERLRKKER